MVASLELFSGAGGLAKGLELAGAEHRAFVEWNRDACETLKINYDPALVHNVDVRNFDFSKIKNVDFIAGGPPCQPFSMGGKHRGNEDSRDMFPYAIKAIRTLTPKAFIFENVKGLLRKSFSSYFNYITLQLTYPSLEKDSFPSWTKHLEALEELHTSGRNTELGYNVVYRLLNAADFGIPQKRERVVIVGIRRDLDVGWNFPSPTHSQDALLWSKFVDRSYWERHRISGKKQEHLSPVMKSRVKRLKDRYGFFEPELNPWRTVRDATGDLPEPNESYSSTIYPDHIFKGGARSYPGHTGSYIDAPSKTIKAGDHGVPGGENMLRNANGTVRYFTVLEAKRIQTFPDNYTITGAWSEAMRQIGNAVPVELGRFIASDLLKKINPSSTAKEELVPHI